MTIIDGDNLLWALRQKPEEREIEQALLSLQKEGVQALAVSCAFSPVNHGQERLARDKARLMQMDDKFMSRGVNEGFSGGEKKRNEILQMAVLEPKLAILDETDSGLDIDALKIVSVLIGAVAPIPIITTSTTRAGCSPSAASSSPANSRVSTGRRRNSQAA
mgnify:CR=1 FL=1